MMFDKIMEFLRQSKNENSGGKPVTAEVGVEQAVVATQAEMLKDLGNRFMVEGALAQAEGCYRQAIAADPLYADAINNLGVVLRQQGLLAEARIHLEEAVRLKPGLANAHYNLGAVLRDQGDLNKAAVHFVKAIDLNPNFPAAYDDLAQTHFQRGDPDLARQALLKGLAARPDFAEFHANLGDLYRLEGDLDKSAACYRQALGLKKDLADINDRLGNVYWELGKPDQALASYRNAVLYQPTSASAQCNLGMALHTLGKLSEAIACYRNACAFKSDYAEAHFKLGHALYEFGDFSAAGDSYQIALDLGYKSASVRHALMLPPIMGTRQEVLECRAEFERKLDRLLAGSTKIDDPLSVGTANFYLAFQGLNDRDLQIKVACFYAQACPSLLYVAPHCLKLEPCSGRRIRVGFLSKFVFTHSVSRCFSRVVEDLSNREHFDVALISTHDVDDKDYRSNYARFAGRRIHLPLNLAGARETLAALNLDILVYLDIGMEAFSYFLAFSRLAPVQCVCGGHPVTTGITNLDYFLSAGIIEPENAEQHYSEKLVCLPTGMVYFERPILPPRLKTRRELGLPETRHIYMCPMALQKIHPDFDEAVTRILELDADGVVVLFGDGRYPHWQKLLTERFRKTLEPKIQERVTFLPWLADYDDFLGAVAAADVILDPFHFGLGSTAIATFALGAPFVTLPGEFMRGRVGLGYCKMMDLHECVAGDIADYARKAVAFATDADLRRMLRKKILANNHLFYENRQPIDDIARFFQQIVSY